MKLDIRTENGKAIATLSGEIDHHNARELRSELDRYIIKSQPRMLAMDFGNITFMDSSGIGLVMGRYKLLGELGGSLEVIGLSDNSYKVMRLAGLDRIANIKKGGKNNGI